MKPEADARKAIDDQRERDFDPRASGRKKNNAFRNLKVADIDFKDVNTLKYFVTERGNIIPARVTGVTSKQQRAIARAVKQARQLALLPFLKVD